MPSRTVNFDDDELYVGNRPVVDLVLYGPGGPQGHTSLPIAAALVDTGADFSQLDIAGAQHVGLDPTTQGRHVRVATAGGLVWLWQMPADIEVLGHKVRIEVQFGSGAASIFGREGIFQALEQAGFTTRDWLQKFYVASPGAGPPDSDPEKTALLDKLGVEEPDRPAARIRFEGDYVVIGSVRIRRKRPGSLLEGFFHRR
jgi:hypothetical protein